MERQKRSEFMASRWKFPSKIVVLFDLWFTKNHIKCTYPTLNRNKHLKWPIKCFGRKKKCWEHFRLDLCSDLKIAKLLHTSDTNHVTRLFTNKPWSTWLKAVRTNAMQLTSLMWTSEGRTKVSTTWGCSQYCPKPSMRKIESWTCWSETDSGAAYIHFGVI